MLCYGARIAPKYNIVSNQSLNYSAFVSNQINCTIIMRKIFLRTYFVQILYFLFTCAQISSMRSRLLFSNPLSLFNSFSSWLKRC